MWDMSTTPRHLARDQRLARIRAARETAPTYVTVDTTAGQIRPGDFLVRIPTQHGVRGVEADATVAAVEADCSWGYSTGPRRPKMPVDGVRLTFAAAAADAWTPEVSVPSAFAVTVRRPA